MLSLQEVRKLVGDESLSDEEAGELRDAAYRLAEVLLDALQNLADQHLGDRKQID